jgi:hypothetical protein
MMTAERVKGRRHRRRDLTLYHNFTKPKSQSITTLRSQSSPEQLLAHECQEEMEEPVDILEVPIPTVNGGECDNRQHK